MNSKFNIQRLCVSQGYKFFVTLIIFGVLLSTAYADIVTPTITNVYFEKDGKAHNEPVNFTVNCYGYSWPPGPPVEMPPGTYTPEKVFSFSATCPQYGCEIYENYYLNYRHTDYCDLEGETEGKQFVIRNYASSPVDLCEWTHDNPEFQRKCGLRFNIPTDSGVANKTIEWWFVQHRRYGDGGEFNVAPFAIRDTMGNYIMEDVITSIKLYDPDGNEVMLDAGFGGMRKGINGRYDADSGQWKYDDEFHEDSYYKAVFHEPLKSGTYHYVLTDNQGNTLESHKECDASAAELPIISSESFNAYKDRSGNFIWTWDVPYNISPDLKTSVMAELIAVDGGVETGRGEIVTKVPTHMGRVFVPGNVFQRLEGAGNGLKLRAQLRMNDDSNRAYSDSVVLNMTEVPLLPESSDGGYMVTSDLWIRAVINTEEKGAVNAVFFKGEEKRTERGDTVIWGYFYANPADVIWGDRGNPDLYVKLWFDVTGRVDVNFFHVSVPAIEVHSAYPHNGNHSQQGTATTDERHIRHEYWKKTE